MNALSKYSRVLTCTGPCQQPIRIDEPQGPFTNPDTFVCATCMETAGTLREIDHDTVKEPGR